jgi:hypothetical protein
MPSTTTTTTSTSTPSGPVPAEAARLRRWSHLIDYELHHSDTSTESPIPSHDNSTINIPHVQRTEQSSLYLALHNPLDWPANHRRIPQYRPINRELDQNQRRVYTSTGERVFLTMMFSGLQVNVVSFASFFPSVLYERWYWGL